MGEQRVLQVLDEERTRAFTRAVLSDIWALEQLLTGGQIESGVRRIGAEQEMFLVDRNMRPAPIVAPMLRLLNDSRYTTELAKFNLEANTDPKVLSGQCLRALESELNELLDLARKNARSLDADVLLAGVLPTLTLSDLTLANLTDSPRYHELNRMLSEFRGSKFTVYIKGLDEIQVSHDNMMMEACNTSFQMHLQVDPQEFVAMYNIAQAITGPVLAAAVNSPMLFGKRLWAETRLALFQHSVDERSEVEQARFRPSRVSFGHAWVRDSVLDIFRENVARFRILLTHAIDEEPATVLERGEVPRLSALCVHNGTVWHWNRPCYGILHGRPHLRIENRVLPSGPTIQDEVANAALFYGLMSSLLQEYGPIDSVMTFEDAVANFNAAARYGLNAQMKWVHGRCYSASELLLKHLIPLAHSGLAVAGVDSEDADRYLGIVEERVDRGQTGAQWTVRSMAALQRHGTPEVGSRLLVSAMLRAQQTGEPVHRWPLPEREETGDWRENCRTVSQYMSTDLYTVRPDDLIDLVASIMHWEHIHHVPVEDRDGRLVGLVSQRDLLVLLAQGSTMNRSHVPVHSVMKKAPVTVTPETSTLNAINLMRERRIGCLPVVRDGKLVGIVTTNDMLTLAGKLFENGLRERGVNHGGTEARRLEKD